MFAAYIIHRIASCRESLSEAAICGMKIVVGIGIKVMVTINANRFPILCVRDYAAAVGFPQKHDPGIAKIFLQIPSEILLGISP